MMGSALLAVTIVPVMMGYLIRGKIRPEHKNPVNRFLVWIYHPLKILVGLNQCFSHTHGVLKVNIVIARSMDQHKVSFQFVDVIDRGIIIIA